MLNDYASTEPCQANALIPAQPSVEHVRDPAVLLLALDALPIAPLACATGAVATLELAQLRPSSLRPILTHLAARVFDDATAVTLAAWEASSGIAKRVLQRAERGGQLHAGTLNQAII